MVALPNRAGSESGNEGRRAVAGEKRCAFFLRPTQYQPPMPISFALTAAKSESLIKARLFNSWGTAKHPGPSHT
eukprot:1216227-Alexandrium_andersonii.AAC.1